MIQAQGVTKRFGAVSALNGMDFVAPDGAITSLLGANGAGKTTMLRAITGLVQPDEGAISVDGVNPRSQRIASLGRLGVLPDEYGLYERLTAREHLDYAAAIHGLNGKERQAAVDAAIRSLEMSTIADRRVRGFSLGERMKVALGSAIVHCPANLLLDEPTRGLDVLAVRTLRRVLLELKERGVCILIASHVMAEVARLADRVVIISAGKVVACASPGDLLATTGTQDIEDAFVSLATTERS
jgi:sodium transport system ATP-binding protein